MTASRSGLRSVVQVAVAGLVASVALLAYAAYRIDAQGAIDERREVDAIVVLGAAQFNGTPGIHADGRQDRAQRHMLVWLRAEVQEVPRPLMA